ncbi:MAG TPA: hypothetical protein VGN17_00545 [Bryobacteraceae bacterium]
MRIPFFSRKAALAYPVPPAPPTAVLKPWFRPRGLVRVFPQGWNAAAAAFTPCAIAGTWAQMEALLPEHIPSLTHALIVLARPGEPLLTAAQRDKLWRAFRVPVFEQIIGDRGVVLAAECEAHDGLHIESASFKSKLPRETAPCGCGRKTPRLKPSARTEAARVIAAYAR